MTTRTSARWRVVTWNLHGAAHPNLELVAEVLEGYAADAVCAQEVRRGGESHGARADHEDGQGCEAHGWTPG